MRITGRRRPIAGRIDSDWEDERAEYFRGGRRSPVSERRGLCKMDFARRVERAGDAFAAGKLSRAQWPRAVDSGKRERNEKSCGGFGGNPTRGAATLCGSLRRLPWQRWKRRNADGAGAVSEAAGFARGAHAEAGRRRTFLDY